MDTLIDLLRSDGSIVINKKLAHRIGLNETIMYSELLSRYNYFAEKGRLKNGYFFNTIEDLEKGTTLSKFQQAHAIKRLVKLGLIEYRLMGLPAKRHFKINLNKDRLVRLLSSSLPESGKPGFQKAAPNNINFNNTHGNNTNSQSLNTSSQRKNCDDVCTKMDFSIFNKLKNGQNPIDDDQWNIGELLIRHLEIYRSHYGAHHPPIKDDKMNDLIDRFADAVYAICAHRDVEEILDDYWARDLDCDHNLNHLISWYEGLGNKIAVDC